MSQQTKQAQPQPKRMPLLYTDPQPITAEAFKGKSVRTLDGYSYAGGVHAVPLNAVEFTVAQRYFPIVFSGEGENIIPLAILGIEQGKNLFVDEKGTWREESYIPAYIRRYPFVFFEVEGGKHILCVETSNGQVEKGDKHPLFDDKGDPSELTQNALEFCRMYQEQMYLTQKFARELDEKGLLAPYNANVEMNDGRKLAVTGFRVVDEKKLADLPQKQWAEWGKNGYLGLIYAQMFSSGAWHTLVRLAGGHGIVGGKDAPQQKNAQQTKK